MSTITQPHKRSSRNNKLTKMDKIGFNYPSSQKFESRVVCSTQLDSRGLVAMTIIGAIRLRFTLVRLHTKS